MPLNRRRRLERFHAESIAEGGVATVSELATLWNFGDAPSLSYGGRGRDMRRSPRDVCGGLREVWVRSTGLPGRRACPTPPRRRVCRANSSLRSGRRVGAGGGSKEMWEAKPRAVSPSWAMSTVATGRGPKRAARILPGRRPWRGHLVGLDLAEELGQNRDFCLSHLVDLPCCRPLHQRAVPNPIPAGLMACARVPIGIQAGLVAFTRNIRRVPIVQVFFRREDCDACPLREASPVPPTPVTAAARRS